jgi:hypothetical protein
MLPQLKCGVQYGRNTDTPRNVSHPKQEFRPPPQLKARKEFIYTYTHTHIQKAAIFISFYKSQRSKYHNSHIIKEILHHILLTVYLYTGIRNSNDRRLNAIASTANLH